VRLIDDTNFHVFVVNWFYLNVMFVCVYKHILISGVDRLGNSYYYNKYTMKVINPNLLTKLFIDRTATRIRIYI